MRVAVGGIVLAASTALLGLWAVLGDLPLLQNPFRSIIPQYLEPSTASVTQAKRGAGSPEDLLEALAGTLQTRLEAGDPLWSTLSQYGREAAVETWRDGRRVSLGNADAWAVPADPSWSEDPFANVTWQTYYHSLAWLQAPARIARAGDVNEADTIKEYVLDWIGDNVRDEPPSIRSWYDHAVAWRTDTFLGLMPGILLEASDGQELDAIFRSLVQHGRLLHGYLSAPQFKGHNHNLFHAMSLYNLASALPELRESEQWRAAAIDRVATLLDEMVDRDGVSTEQAATYQFVALGLFTRAVAHLEARGEAVDPEITDRLNAMALYAALLGRPDGSLPAYGDTPYGATVNHGLLDDLLESGFGGDELRYLLTEGASGHPPESLHVFPEAGYALMRPSIADPAAWDSALHVFFDLGAPRRVHGHDDALNVIAWAGGGPILIDSGGPYVYRDGRRRAFVAPQAHNTVIVDSRGYRAEDLQQTAGVLVAHGGEDDLLFVTAEHSQWESVRHRRTVATIDERLLVVVDRIADTDAREHEIDLLWHLSPATTLSEPYVANSSYSALLMSDRGAAGMTVTASTTLSASVVAGESSPDVGWVTRGILRKEPAPVLTIGVAGRVVDLVTVVAPVTDVTEGVPDVQLQGTGDDLSVSVRLGDAVWELQFPDGGRPPSGARIAGE